jgi:hypothetical protein
VCSGVCLVGRRSLPPCRAERDDHHRHSAGVPGVGFWQRRFRSTGHRTCVPEG